MSGSTKSAYRVLRLLKSSGEVTPEIATVFEVLNKDDQLGSNGVVNAVI